MNDKPFRASPRQHELFLAVRDDIVDNAHLYKRAGEMLDVQWSYEAIKRRKHVADKRFLGVGPDDPDPPWLTARREEAIRRAFGVQDGQPTPEVTRHEIMEVNRPYFRTLQFIERYLRWANHRSEPLDLSAMPVRRALIHARLLLLVTWICTDPEAHKRSLHLTNMETTPFDKQDVLGRSWARGHVFGTTEHDRDTWIELAENALLLVRRLPHDNVPRSRRTLSDLQRDLLHAFAVEGALTQDSRMTAEAIAAKAIGNVGADAVKHALAELSRWGYLHAKMGRGGGYWLTEKIGVEAARQVMEERGEG